MKPPKFIGVFPSQFPGWGGDDKPVFHHKTAQGADGKFVMLAETHEKPCNMAFHSPGGTCMSIRYSPVGVSGIDAAGNCWVLVHDFAGTGHAAECLRWVKFVAEVAE